MNTTSQKNINSLTFIDKIFGDLSWRPSDELPNTLTSSLKIENETPVETLTHQSSSQDLNENISVMPIEQMMVETTGQAVSDNQEVENVIVFAIDLPNKKPGLYHLDFIPESEAEVMLKKMITALNLNDGQWRIWVCEQQDGPVDKELMPSFKSALAEFPHVKIYSFGVRVLEFLLGNKLRVSEVIGQTFTSLMGASFTPLFHPDYLLINPAMKKRVWEVLIRPMPPV